VRIAQEYIGELAVYFDATLVMKMRSLRNPSGLIDYDRKLNLL